MSSGQCESVLGVQLNVTSKKTTPKNTDRRARGATATSQRSDPGGLIHDPSRHSTHVTLGHLVPSSIGERDVIPVVEQDEEQSAEQAHGCQCGDGGKTGGTLEKRIQ